MSETTNHSNHENASTSQDDAAHSEAVMRLYSQHQRWLFGYLTSLTGNPGDAEDVMQEVCVVMWQQHEKFQLGTNFVSWLSVIAYRQVQKFWRDNRKNKLFVNDDIIGQLAETMSEDFELQEARRKALADCVSRLKNSDRELIAYLYGDRKMTMKSVAEQLDRKVGTVYRAIRRIRECLFDCINRKTENLA